MSNENQTIDKPARCEASALNGLLSARNKAIKKVMDEAQKEFDEMDASMEPLKAAFKLMIVEYTGAGFDAAICYTEGI